MQVRIQNDGKQSYTTRFTSVETGEELQYVTEATIHMEASEPLPKAVITMILPVLDLVVEAEINTICPCCKRKIVEEEEKHDATN